MNIIADENMPYVDDLFSELGHIQKVDGRKLTAVQLRNADILLVRSVTKVNQRLLSSNSQLQFVGSATIGTDHVDLDYLAHNNIAYANAPGCNAKAVGEFAFMAMLALAERYHTCLKDKVVGIVGAGNTGSALCKCLQAYGVKTLLCDPLLQAAGDKRQFYSLTSLLRQCDVISLHVPITKYSQYPTWHLFDQQQLSKLKANAWLLNCARGEVIDNLALIKVKKQRPDLNLVLDVWEQEPNPNQELVTLADFATPHIAGYSLEGKVLGTFMLYKAVCQYFGITASKSLTNLLPVSHLPLIKLDHSPSQTELLSLCRRVYDLNNDDKAFRQCVNSVGGFDQMRKNHTHRREFSALSLANTCGSEVDWVFNLGFSGVSL